MTTAHDILDAAAKHMRDRAAHYDSPEGERSMAATVAAFEAITGIEIGEEEGWLFMALLKAVRSQQGDYRADNYEDFAAYAALMGEAARQSANEEPAGERKPERVATWGGTVQFVPTDEATAVVGPCGNEVRP